MVAIRGLGAHGPVTVPEARRASVSVMDGMAARKGRNAPSPHGGWVP